jgi:hypothetical protein
MPGSIFQLLTHILTTLSFVACDLVRLLVLVSRSRRALVAENLFLRKQLALFRERKVKQHRPNDSTRLVMVILGRMFSWRGALVNVKPDTFLRWHRKGFRLFWRWKSRPPGRPPLPKDLRRLIREMAAENPTWGEERIANELQLKLTIRVSLVQDVFWAMQRVRASAVRFPCIWRSAWAVGAFRKSAAFITAATTPRFSTPSKRSRTSGERTKRSMPLLTY